MGAGVFKLPVLLGVATRSIRTALHTNIRMTPECGQKDAKIRKAIISGNLKQPHPKW